MEVLLPDVGSDLAPLFTKLRIYDGSMQIIYGLFKVDFVKEFVGCFLKQCVSRENHCEAQTHHQ